MDCQKPAGGFAFLELPIISISFYIAFFTKQRYHIEKSKLPSCKWNIVILNPHVVSVKIFVLMTSI